MIIKKYYFKNIALCFIMLVPDQIQSAAELEQSIEETCHMACPRSKRSRQTREISNMDLPTVLRANIEGYMAQPESVSDREVDALLPKKFDDLWHASVSHNGRYLAMRKSGAEENLVVWDLQQSELVREIRMAGAAASLVNTITMSSDTTFVVVGLNGRPDCDAIASVGVLSGSIEHRFGSCGDLFGREYVRSLCKCLISPDSSRIVTVEYLHSTVSQSADSYLKRVWCARSGRLISHLKNDEPCTNDAVSVNRDNTVVSIGTEGIKSSHLRSFNVSTGVEIYAIPGFTNAVAFSSNGNVLARASNNALELRDTMSGTLLQVMEHLPSTNIHSLTFDKNDRCLISSSSDEAGDNIILVHDRMRLGKMVNRFKIARKYGRALIGYMGSCITTKGIGIDTLSIWTPIRARLALPAMVAQQLSQQKRLKCDDEKKDDK